MTKLTATTAPGKQLNVDALLEKAQRKTGLTDFGDPWFMEPLKVLVHYINAEADLPSDDVPPVHHTIDMLCDRLRLTAYLKQHPGVLNERIHMAGIILGQARGGSTLTQRLVAQSPQLTSTYFWEMFTPVPLPDEQPGNPVARRKIGDDEVASWGLHMPEYKGMHPLNSSYYEEDAWLMDRCFDSYLYTLHFNIPGYYEWMLTQDHTKAYQDLKLWLQLLQYQAPDRKGKKWILKNVTHPMTLNLPTMFKTFPETKAIQTHRAMDQVIPSLCSVQSVHIRTSGSKTFDKREMGPRLVEQQVAGYHQAMKLQREMPAGTFINIKYKDMIGDPIGQFRKVIEGMGLVCGLADIAAAETWMSQNGRGTHPPHNYKPEDFGVTAAGLNETFKFYHDAFLT